MTDKRLEKLVLLLAEKTDAGELPWEESEVSNAFHVSFTHGTARIEVRDSRQFAGDQEFILKIINSSGAEVERISDESSDVEGAYALMKKTYEGARRKAMQVDIAIDSMIDDLESGIF
ncbi:hypothetical protein [Luteimonas saliphila]|uniref:hypothetical protein n=1 Tax=Luteimonas saliphila TaxID=2804919 RepID=UPI00192D9AE8|nr:hypothetical protein [Luteimonas saliphila]